MYEDPSSYCRTAIVSKGLDFTLWNQESKLKACEEGGDQMLTQCKDANTLCNPCAYTVAYMFAKYEKSVETTLENIFKQMSIATAKSLL